MLHPDECYQTENIQNNLVMCLLYTVELCAASADRFNVFIDCVTPLSS